MKQFFQNLQNADVCIDWGNRGNIKQVPLLPVVVGILIMLVATMSSTYKYKKARIETLKLQQENADLQASQNVMVWTMDKSCFDQLNNSSGIMSLKLQKGGE